MPRHGVQRVSGFPYVGDTGWMYRGHCFCGWTTDKDPSWRSAGVRVQAHAADKERERLRQARGPSNWPDYRCPACGAVGDPYMRDGKQLAKCYCGTVFDPVTRVEVDD